MADLKSVPFPRFPEPSPRWLVERMTQEGMDAEAANRIGMSFQHQFSRMADEYTANIDFLTALIRDANADIEDLPVGATALLSGSDISIDGAGTSVVGSLSQTLNVKWSEFPTTFDTAIHAVEARIEWTDGYRGGGTVELTIDGTVQQVQWDDSGPWRQWSATELFKADTDLDLDVTVTPADGSSHTADVTVRLSVVEKLRNVVDGSLQMIAYVGTTNSPPIDYYSVEVDVTNDVITFGNPTVFSNSNSIANSVTNGYFQLMRHNDDQFVMPLTSHHLTFSSSLSVDRTWQQFDGTLWPFDEWAAALPESVSGDRVLTFDSGVQSNWYKPRLTLWEISNGLVGTYVDTLVDPGYAGGGTDPNGNMGYVHQLSADRWLAACVVWDAPGYAWEAVVVYLVDTAGDTITIVDEWRSTVTDPFEAMSCRVWEGEFWICTDDENGGNYDFSFYRVTASGDTLVVGPRNVIASTNIGEGHTFCPGRDGDNKALLISTASTSAANQENWIVVLSKSGDVVTADKEFQLENIWMAEVEEAEAARMDVVHGNYPLSADRWLLAGPVFAGTGGDQSLGNRFYVGLVDVSAEIILDMKKPYPDSQGSSFWHVAGRYVQGTNFIEI